MFSSLPRHNEVAAMNQTLQFGDMQVDGPSLAEVCRRYGVKELSLFGSAVRGEMRVESDIDLLVEFEPGVRIGLIKFESLVDELESLVGRTVDLVTKRGLKPWVRPTVLKDAKSSMRREPSFLKDILSACSKIEAIMAATSEDLFLKDEVLSAAVLHHLTVIGEAINRLSVKLRERHPEVPWRI
jgi:predicted nucleotidyltransferase